MNPQTTSPLRHPHERTEKIGKLGGQGGKLINDHQEPGKRFGTVVVHDVTDAMGGQYPLPMAKFSFQAHQSPAAQASIEISHHSYGMGEQRQVSERRPTLVIHQHKGDRGGRVVSCQ